MKELPIIFSGEMVRAILEGRKTQTRRVIRPQPPQDVIGYVPHGDEWLPQTHDEDGNISTWGEVKKRLRYSYGEVGDRLWVKETWCHYDDWLYIYEATPPDWASKSMWCPPIFMPREASRVLLEIEEIRVERLQDISEADAKAEGVILATNMSGSTYRWNFWQFWDSIAKPSEKWADNPLVWVIGFKVLGGGNE